MWKSQLFVCLSTCGGAGAYIYRILSLIAMAFFLGTLYLQLSLKTDNMTEIAGGIFYGVWVTLFVVVGGTGIQVTNRLSFQLDVRVLIILITITTCCSMLTQCIR